jgi:hypothetical protein
MLPLPVTRSFSDLITSLRGQSWDVCYKWCSLQAQNSSRVAKAKHVHNTGPNNAELNMTATCVPPVIEVHEVADPSSHLSHQCKACKDSNAVWRHLHQPRHLWLRYMR